MGNKDIKLFIFTDDRIVYKENPKKNQQNYSYYRIITGLKDKG